MRFWCEQPSVQVEVGREAANIYHLENTGREILYIRPIHQVSPIAATPHFGMRLCFCFNDQVIQPGETKTFPGRLHLRAAAGRAHGDGVGVL